MPDSPYLVALAAPDNAAATTILPNGQHYTRPLDETTGALATTVEVWDHDVDAMKAAGFRDPEELGAAQEVHATFPTQPEQESESEPEAQDGQQVSAQAAAPTTDEAGPEPAPEPAIAPESAPEPQAEQQRGRGGGRRQ